MKRANLNSDPTFGARRQRIFHFIIHALKKHCINNWQDMTELPCISMKEEKKAPMNSIYYFNCFFSLILQFSSSCIPVVNEEQHPCDYVRNLCQMGKRTFFIMLKQLWKKPPFSLLQMQKQVSLGTGSSGVGVWYFSFSVSEKKWIGRSSL